MTAKKVTAQPAVEAAAAPIPEEPHSKSHINLASVNRVASVVGTIIFAFIAGMVTTGHLMTSTAGQIAAEATATATEQAVEQVLEVKAVALANGAAVGYTLGRTEGYTLGRTEGYTLGRFEGVAQGRDLERQDLLSEARRSLDELLESEPRRTPVRFSYWSEMDRWRDARRDLQGAVAFLE